MEEEFFNAIKNNNIGKINLLIKQGFNLDLQNKDGAIALTTAIVYNNKIAELLIKEGANLDLQDELGYTALMVAIRTHNNKIARLLIEKGANLDLQDTDGYECTALMGAIRTDNKEIAELLIEKGANLDLQHTNGYTALMVAIKTDNKEIARLLIEKGANLDLQDTNGYTALMEAIRTDNKEIAKLLIEKGANLDLQNGSTVLMFAVKNELDSIIDSIIDSNSNIKEKCNELLEPIKYDKFTTFILSLRKQCKIFESFLQEKVDNIHQKLKESYTMQQQRELLIETKHNEELENLFKNFNIYSNTASFLFSDILTVRYLKEDGSIEYYAGAGLNKQFFTKVLEQLRLILFTRRTNTEPHLLIPNNEALDLFISKLNIGQEKDIIVKKLYTLAGVVFSYTLIYQYKWNVTLSYSILFKMLNIPDKYITCEFILMKDNIIKFNDRIDSIINSPVDSPFGKYISDTSAEDLLQTIDDTCKDEYNLSVSSVENIKSFMDGWFKDCIISVRPTLSDLIEACDTLGLSEKDINDLKEKLKIQKDGSNDKYIDMIIEILENKINPPLNINDHIEFIRKLLKYWSSIDGYVYNPTDFTGNNIPYTIRVVTPTFKDYIGVQTCFNMLSISSNIKTTQTLYEKLKETIDLVGDKFGDIDHIGGSIEKRKNIIRYESNKTIIYKIIHGIYNKNF